MIGIDEAGRGAWAGPLVAAAVLLKRPLAGLADSKRLTPLKREQLYARIHRAGRVGLGVVEPGELDRIGLAASLARVMNEALAQLSPLGETIIVDGPIDYIRSSNSSALIRADDTVEAVMAASIIAKVERDRMMMALDKQWPDYGFGRHKGYGTAAHREAIVSLGPCGLHRYSFRPLSELVA